MTTEMVERTHTLADIEEAINGLLTAYADTAEGITDEQMLADFESAMESLMTDLAEEEAAKIDGYGFMVSKLEAEDERLTRIIEGLTARRKSTRNKIERMKNHVLHIMRLNDLKKIEGHTFIARRRISQVVELTVNPENLDPEYRRVKYEADKVAIKKELEAGGEVTGATLAESDSVTIKA